MNTCDTCKFWSDPYTNTPWPAAVCKHPSMNGDEWPCEDGIAQGDTHGYSPYLLFGPKFGCIHHKPK